MKKVVVINGFPQSGKDTFVRLASKYALVMNYSSVDFVKEVARFAGWNGEKNLHTRKFLSDLKDLLTFLDDIPFKKIEERMRAFYNMEEQEILFIHIREPKEIEKLVKYHPDVITLLIKRPDSEHEFSNHADAMVEEYPYDFVIANNSSLDFFESKAKEFVYNLRKGVSHD